MNMSGLSSEQAPPISVPFRFFITAPIFGMLAGVMIFLYATQVPYLTLLSSVGIVHLITLGVLLMILLGALSQMLPVVAGIVLPKVKLLTFWTHTLFTLGVFALGIGMIQSIGSLMIIGSITLLLALLPFLSIVWVKLLQQKESSATIIVMRYSIAFALMSLGIGLAMAVMYGQGNLSEIILKLRDIHIVWVSFGFVMLLIIGVAYQIVPMFYVTPSYPNWCRFHLASLLFLLLSLWAVGVFFDLIYLEKGARVIVLGSFIGFGVITLKRFRLRKRPVMDTTIRYWMVAMGFNILGMLSLIIATFIDFDEMFYFMVSIIIGGGFVLSLLYGMLYKIVPFMTWFHLSNMGYMNVPMMRELIPETKMRIQFILHFMSLALIAGGYFLPLLMQIGGLFFVLSHGALFYNLLSPILKYREIRKQKPDFEMN
jgi:hypothetical protein